MKIYKSRGDIVKEIILSSDKELGYREIRRIMRKRHQMDVTDQYISLIIKQLKKEGKVQVTYKLTPDPNKIRMFVKPKGS